MIGMDRNYNDEKLMTNNNEERSGIPTYGIASIQGRRPTMEDAHSVQIDFLENDSCASFFAIYDGHGGKAIANYCAQFLHQCVREAFKKSQDMQKALKEGFEKADRDLENSSRYKIARNCGSAVIAAVVDENTIFVAHVGDSRAVLGRTNSTISLTLDHRPDDPQEKERIEKAGGKVVLVNGVARVGQSLAMSRVIGDHLIRGVTATPDIKTTSREQDDEFLLLACDGIFEEGITNEQAAEIVRNSLKKNQAHPHRAQYAAQELVHEAYKSGSEDNLSALVILLRLTASLSHGLSQSHPGNFK